MCKIRENTPKCGLAPAEWSGMVTPLDLLLSFSLLMQLRSRLNECSIGPFLLLGFSVSLLFVPAGRSERSILFLSS